MDERSLIVNTGSASFKYAIYGGVSRLAFGHFEKEGGHFVVNLEFGNKKNRWPISQKDYFNCLDYFLNCCAKERIIENPKDISAIGVRIVAPGKFFAQNRIIGQQFLENLKIAKEKSSLHIAPVIGEIENLHKIFPTVPLLSISDSAFHGSLPPVARTYAIPAADADKFDLYRYGYHGLSFESIYNQIGQILDKIPKKMIFCHLGGGSSLAAINDGRCVDTTMGFTPLEGLAMATRAGDIDPGILIELIRQLKLKPSELENYLNTKSGLLGISGKSDDIRELIELEGGGNQKAKLALDIYIYRIKKYIGAYYAVLGGLDLLVFSGTIGERSNIMRERICQDLGMLGINLDSAKNKETDTQNTIISRSPSPAKVAVICADEMGEMARELGEAI